MQQIDIGAYLGWIQMLLNITSNNIIPNSNRNKTFVVKVHKRKLGHKLLVFS